VESATWLPARVATRWAVRYRRYRVQSSTLANNLRVLARVYRWARETGSGELDNRLTCGEALRNREIESLVDADVRSVAAALGVSPTTLYKYGLNGEINAAERRQRENAPLSGAAIERRYFQDQITHLNAQLEQERERSKGLVRRIAIMEANAARLGFDPEEMHKPILKPVRAMSRTGTNRSGAGRLFRRG
jgi:hypothetical protein